MIALVKKYWTALRVGLVVLWVRLSLRRNNLPLMLDRLTPRAMNEKPDDTAMRRLAGYVDRWLQLFPYSRKGNCFPRSLALYRVARQLGYPVVFHCGVRKADSNLDGHAWLTLDSQIFCEPGKQWQRFTVTFSYPPTPGAGASLASARRDQQFWTRKS